MSYTSERAVVLVQGGLLLVEERDVGDVLLAQQQVVEEVQYQGLGYLLPEHTLEADVGKRVDELCHVGASSLLVEWHKDSLFC